MSKILPFYNRATRELIKQVEEESKYLFELVDYYIADNEEKLKYLKELEEELNETTQSTQ